MRSPAGRPRRVARRGRSVSPTRNRNSGSGCPVATTSFGQLHQAARVGHGPRAQRTPADQAIGEWGFGGPAVIAEHARAQVLRARTVAGDGHQAARLIAVERSFEPRRTARPKASGGLLPQGGLRVGVPDERLRSRRAARRSPGRADASSRFDSSPRRRHPTPRPRRRACPLASRSRPIAARVAARTARRLASAGCSRTRDSRAASALAERCARPPRTGPARPGRARWRAGWMPAPP